MRLALSFTIAFFLVLSSMGPAIIPVVVATEMQMEFGISATTTSFLYALFFFSVGSAGFFIGRKVDKTLYRVLFLISGLSNIVGGIAGYYISNVVIFYLWIGVALPALGSAPFFGPLVAHASTWLPKRQAIAIAIPTLGQLVAFWIWSLLSDFLRPIFGWKGLFIGIAVAGAMQIALVPLIIYEPNVSSRPQIFGDGTRRVLPPYRIILSCFLAFSGATIVLTILPHISSARAGGANFLWGAFSCMAILGRLIFSFAYDRGYALSSVIVTASAMLAGTLILAIANHSFPVSMFGAGLFGFGYSGFLPVMVAFSKQYCFGDPFEVQNRLIFYGTVGIAIGSLVAGALRDLDFASDSITLAALACLICAINLTVCCKIIRRHASRTRP